MSLFGGVIPITGITFLMFSLLIITFLGYALGRISIKGVNLGTAGVFIVALLFGCFFYEPLSAQLTVKMADGTAVNYAENAWKWCVLTNFQVQIWPITDKIVTYQKKHR